MVYHDREQGQRTLSCVWVAEHSLGSLSENLFLLELYLASASA